MNTHELCPFCENENEVDEEIIVAVCKHCGKQIIICSTCKKQERCDQCTITRGMNHTDYCNAKVIAIFIYGKFSYNKIVSGDLEKKESYLWWHKKGFSYTKSGFGKKIPCTSKIRFQNKWYRIYAHCFSNCATFYIVTKKYGDLIIQ